MTAKRLWGSIVSMLAAVSALAVAPSLAHATSITEFKIPSGADPGAVTNGADGNVWFSEDNPIGIGRITPDGAIKEFLKTNTPGFTSIGHPADITLGRDGNVWFTAVGSPPNAIGRITPAGVVTEFPADGQPGHLHSGSAPSSLTVGPDGNLWFADNTNPDSIGKITSAGAVSEYQLTDKVNSNIEDLTVSADGNLWFTDRGNTKSIGRITPSGIITETTTGLNQMTSMPNGITVGGDEKLWFTDEGTLDMSGTGGVGSATTTSTPTVTEATTNIHAGGRPDAVATGRDGTVWFEDNLAGARAIGRVSLPSGTVKEFNQGLGTGLMDDITAGPDGNIWVEQSMPGGIARITPAGTITQFSTGLLPNAGADGDGFTTGPGGNLWFNDRGAKAIGKVSMELPPSTRTTTATIGNQHLVLKTPAKCVAKSSKLGEALTATTRSRGTKLHFTGATFYLDRGVRHTHKRIRHLAHGRKKTITVVVYTPNATAHHLPASLRLRLSSLKSGRHTLKVVMAYTSTTTKHGRRTTRRFSKTMRVTFSVC
jgi:streptogramin lyase